MKESIFSKFSLKNKKIFILGGCGLIGSYISKAALSASAEVLILDKDNKKGKNFIKKYKNSKLKFINFDLSAVKSIEKKFDQITKFFGCPDVFINCSYPATKNWVQSSFQKNKFSILRKNIDIHLNTHSWLSYKVCNLMQKKKVKGSVIMFGSIYGLVGQNENIYKNTKMHENMNYSIIKGGLVTLTKQLAAYYGKFGIRINIVCPGGIEGKIKGQNDKQSLNFKKNYSRQSPLRRLGRPEEVAPSVIFLSSEASSYITGSVFLIDGGWTSI